MPRSSPQTSEFAGPPLDERVSGEGPLGFVGGKPNVVSEDYDDGKWIMDPDAGVTSVKDAEPRSLYVRRDVMNAKAIADHYESQLGDMSGLLMDPAKWHVTIAYSKTPVDWIKVGESWSHGDDDKGWLRVKPGGARLHARLGVESKDAVVLQFTSSHLTYRWRDFCEAGCTWDFDDYQPHVTIAWDKEQILDEDILRSLKPWQGEIVLGPEIFEEIDENWKAKAGISDDLFGHLVVDWDEDQERDDDGKFASGGGGGGKSGGKSGGQAKYAIKGSSRGVKSVSTKDMVAMQSSRETNKGRVSYYREQMRANVKLEPITAVYSKESGKFHILDGHHRWMAAKEEKINKIPVKVVLTVDKTREATAYYRAARFG